ncbi:calcium-binding protein [Arenibacterium sp. LLYu02]|uniref:calcium-binding protein n=1 Tax=Arenibacterium sp. LLYu02 TaxID=3404132 RepID=UPI003B2166BC
MSNIFVDNRGVYYTFNFETLSLEIIRDTFGSFTGVAVTPAGAAYTTNEVSLDRFFLDGSFAGGDVWVLSNGYIVASIATDKRGNLYVAREYSSEIEIFSPTKLSTVGTFSLPTDLHLVHTIEIAENDGVFYWTNNYNLFAMDLKDPSSWWIVDTKVYTALFFEDDQFFGVSEGALYRIDAENGGSEWIADLNLEERHEISGAAGYDYLAPSYSGDDDVVLDGSLNLWINVSIGNDTVVGHSGRDRVRGGIGDDDLSGLGGNDRLYGGRGNDTLSGGRGKDELRGEIGNDVLRGGAGSDTLEGGGGRNILVGGSGADSFVFHGDGGRHTIVDFEFGRDQILIDHRNFTNKTWTAQDVIDTYGYDGGDELVLFIGNGGRVVIETTEDLSALVDSVILF